MRGVKTYCGQLRLGAKHRLRGHNAGRGRLRGLSAAWSLLGRSEWTHRGLGIGVAIADGEDLRGGGPSCIRNCKLDQCAGGHVDVPLRHSVHTDIE